MLASAMFWFLITGAVVALIVWLIAQAIVFTLAQSMSDE